MIESDPEDESELGGVRVKMEEGGGVQNTGLRRKDQHNCVLLEFNDEIDLLLLHLLSDRLHLSLRVGKLDLQYSC